MSADEKEEKMRGLIFYDQWLQGTADLTAQSARRLLEEFPAPEALLEASEEKLAKVLPPGQLRILSERRRQAGSLSDMREEYEKLSGRGICFVSSRQREFPERLREIPDPPAGLYFRGRLPEKDSLTVAVVGARDCTEYGRRVAEELGTFLGQRGIEVVSGMARGIDGISQQAALKAGGVSFAVLGCGADVCYPSSNRWLYDLLAESGGILSSYPPGTPPLARNFPPRNRIVSGLADAVVVVEAREKSGTLITVDMALEQGREVYVVPGRVTDRLSDGCNRLLKQGAEVYLNPESFLEELEELAFLKRIASGKGRKRREKTARGEQADEGSGGESRMRRAGRTAAGKCVQDADMKEEWAEVYRALDDTPKSPEQISEELGGGRSLQELSVVLMELAMDGRAKQVSAGHFCRL